MNKGTGSQLLRESLAGGGRLIYRVYSGLADTGQGLVRQRPAMTAGRICGSLAARDNAAKAPRRTPDARKE
ncbi:MAG: hypothetical protein ABSB74_18580 [Tepidisphaeraceae bacterium]